VSRFQAVALALAFVGALKVAAPTVAGDAEKKAAEKAGEDAEAKPSELLTSEAVEVKLKDGRGTAVVYLRGGTTDEKLSFDLLLQSAEGKPVRATARASDRALPRHKAKGFALEIEAASSGPASGFLVIEAEQGTRPPLSIAVKTAPAPARGPWGARAVFWTLLLAGLLFLVVAVQQGPTWSDTMGMPKWDVAESWVTNLTVAGSAIALFVGAEWLPEKTVLAAKKEYVVLSVLAAVLIGLAPFFYNAFRTVKPNSDPPEHVGPVWAFMVAVVLALWAGYLQIALTGLLLEEVQRAKVLTTSVARLFQALLALSALGSVVYGYRILRGGAKGKPPRARRERGRAAPATPTWSLP
jgi:hypothetical protein